MWTDSCIGRDGHPGGMYWPMADTLPTRQGAAQPSDDEGHGLPSGFVSDLQDVMVEGAVKCYKHYIAIFSS